MQSPDTVPGENIKNAEQWPQDKQICALISEHRGCQILTHHLMPGSSNYIQLQRCVYRLLGSAA